MTGTGCAGRETWDLMRWPRLPVAGIRIPAWNQKTAEIRQKSAHPAPPPTAGGTGAWAMFLTNNHVKNDINVSRETLPNI